jgi:solute carrier family 13 (sodium-dependent dicarboxylate transporter), member 2/3/5
MNPVSFKFSPGYKHLLFGILALVLAFLSFVLVPGDTYPKAPAMAAIVMLMAVCWVFEVIPIPVTSLFPIVLMPAFGIMDVESSTAHYGKSTIFLFLGGFILALALQESNVHRRMALSILKFVGTQPSRLVLGFMISTAFISMWISNTATVMVMLPIALSVLEQSKRADADPKQMRNFAAALMLGIAFSADIGGMATIIGTAPNVAYRQLLTELYPNAPKAEFVDWMKMGIPLAILFIGIGWLMMVKLIFPMRDKGLLGGGDMIASNLKALGKVRRDEWVTLAVFGLAVLLWLSGSRVTLTDTISLPGWRDITTSSGNMPLKGIDDSIIAVFCAILLFLIPSGDRPGQAMMRWDVANKLPWGILLLFGGGFAIAGGFGKSGLSELVGVAFQGLPKSSPVLLIMIVCIALTFLTEITSNTAITNLTLPILAKASVAMGVDPRILMIPATISASCAFMMPVASPTQAIVFGSGHINIRQMMRAGIWFNLLGIILVGGLFLLLSNWAWGIDFTVLPDWSK